MQNLIARSHQNQINAWARFGGSTPLAYKDQIARLPGVTKISYSDYIAGYYREKKNAMFIQMMGKDESDIMTDMSLTPAQWTELQVSRTGIFVSQTIAARYHLKAGDTFPVLTAAVTRKDGTKLWPFTVLAVVDDIPEASNGYAVGNYDYLDETRPLAQRGTANTIHLLVNDPARADGTANAIEAMFANSGTPIRSVTEKAMNESAAQAGINIPFVTTVVASAGLFMILFLTGNGIAQSVRERIPEFAVLKTLGFSDAGVMALVFIEAAIPCLMGACHRAFLRRKG